MSLLEFILWLVYHVYDLLQLQWISEAGGKIQLDQEASNNNTTVLLQLNFTHYSD